MKGALIRGVIFNWMVPGEVQRRPDRPKMGDQGVRMLGGFALPFLNFSLLKPFSLISVMRRFASLTDKDRRDKMTMLRPIILFFIPACPVSLLSSFIHI